MPCISKRWRDERGGTRWCVCARVLETVSAFARRKTDASDSFMEGLRKGGGERKFYRETNTRVLFTDREITVERSQKGKFVVTLGSDNLLPS